LNLDTPFEKSIVMKRREHDEAKDDKNKKIKIVDN
jgi:hypothetical protein